MNDDFKKTKEDLIGWIDRPPSNYDLDLCSYLANAVENQHKYLNENEQLKKQYCERTDCAGRIGNSKKVEQLQNNWNELKEWLKREHREDAIKIDLSWKHATGKILNKINELEGKSE